MRLLGRSGIEVSAIGFGCWAIGGPFYRDGSPAGWGEVDDTESAAALRRALDLGITFFDTADVYGAGRTPAQGALGWLLARSPRTVPIPGIRTVAQAEQNAVALQLGPLTPAQLAEISQLLQDEGAPGSN